MAFLMLVELFESASPNHMIARGIVQTGTVSTGDIIQVMDFEQRVENASVIAASNTTLTLISLQGQYQSGWIIAPPGAVSFHKHFRADVRLLTEKEGSKNKPLPLVVGYAPIPASHYETMRVRFAGANLSCVPRFPHSDLFDYLEALPGETVKLNLAVVGVLPVKIGSQFQLLDNPHDVIAIGTVTDLLD
jgi:translation elongation factor EF-Tu-like GTPase